jgi:6-phosphogluconolactonase
VDPKRQKEPHAHQILLDPAGQIAYVPDLGIDKVMIYRFDASKGTLEPAPSPFAAMKPGDGPRHIAFHPGGRFAYVINEMSSTIAAFARTDGALQERGRVSSLPPDLKPLPDYSTADVQVHPSGRFLYGSNRGHDSITAYTIDQDDGRLRFVEAESTGGRTPRAFGIDPSGRFLLAANQRSDSVVVFRIDERTGALTPTGASIQVGAPVCVKFLAPR